MDLIPTLPTAIDNRVKRNLLVTILCYFKDERGVCRDIAALH